MFGKVKINERKTLDANNNEVITNVYAKSTAIVIIDGVNKYVYRVDEHEVEDLAGISNLTSFMQFDRYDAQMTNCSN